MLFLASFHNNDATLSQFHVLNMLCESFVESMVCLCVCVCVCVCPRARAREREIETEIVCGTSAIVYMCMFEKR